ncbi:MAG: MATE family efflux transporter [Woeseiaceae bacterium]|nr:MATE family efflux transporter [Woeseiaceae bacterium]
MSQRADRLPEDRDIWRIALPMILSNITVPLLGMVDTGVVGHLDSAAYLGAVAIATTIFGFIYIGMNFLRMGTTGISAQRFGARDTDGIRTALGQALLTALFIAVALIALQSPIAQISMPLLGATGDIEVYAREYFAIRIWSAPATLAGYVLVGWFIGMQNARIPLLIVVTVNLVNIVLDLLFVLVFDMKVAGVALASVIAEYTGAALGLFFAARLLTRHPGQWVAHKLLRLREYAAFFSVNVNLLIRTLALVFTISFVTAQGARMGGLVLAANAILMQFQNLMAFGLDGVAHAAEALVGKAVGQERRDALERAVSLSLKWSLVFAGGFSFLYLVGGPLLINILTDLPDVRQTTLVYLPWMIASPLISVWSFLYDGVFVGATRAKEMRNIMLVSAFVVFLPAWYLFQPFGNHGLWAAFMLFLLARGVGMHVGYRRVVLPAA